MCDEIIRNIPRGAKHLMLNHSSNRLYMSIFLLRGKLSYSCRYSIRAHYPLDSKTSEIMLTTKTWFKLAHLKTINQKIILLLLQVLQESNNLSMWEQQLGENISDFYRIISLPLSWISSISTRCTLETFYGKRWKAPSPRPLASSNNKLAFSS